LDYSRHADQPEACPIGASIQTDNEKRRTGKADLDIGDVGNIIYLSANPM
jgi:hypothetical protein